jgi:glycosyltransferase involved in cell wall biosynthesis
LQDDGLYRYKGFEYYSQNELDLPSKNLIQKIYRFLFLGSKTIKWHKDYLASNEVNYIIVYNSNSYFILRLFFLSKRFKFKLVCDCTEWNEGNHLPGGKYGIVNLDNNIRIRIIYPIIKNVIVISSYLKKYLQQKGCNTITVPPLVDLADSKWNVPARKTHSPNHKIIKIIYAGDPGKKDLLTSVFSALEFVNSDLIHIEFHILGIEEVSLKKSFFADIGEIPTYIHCFGRVPHEKVPEYYCQCHFSILLREDKRYAHAGFPTKLVESLASGVPIITNRTSDIPQYIVNGENGFLLDNTTDQTLIKCFQHILTLNENEISLMSQKSKLSSSKHFDFPLFSNGLNDFLYNLS